MDLLHWLLLARYLSRVGVTSVMLASKESTIHGKLVAKNSTYAPSAMAEWQEEKAPINLKIDSDNRVFPCFNARIARSITGGFCQLWGDLCVSYGA